MSFFNNFINITAINEAEITRQNAEATRIANENTRISSGALIKSGGSMSGDINMSNENGIKLNDKYKIKYNSALNTIDILVL